ncbi:hypothetical protein PROP_02932 [Propionicimonas sp. T2.31MG-18]|uniref:TIR domain-containing protein n=1 Tax=Propionicimonas sp. T2.31MG-18 TaxID=3157620 RepID=UPI0035E6C9B2
MKIFISYNHCDQNWAEWISWELERSRHQVTIQAWDFEPGANFVLEMHSASAEADRTILVLSEDYLASGFTAAEWAAVFATDPTGKRRHLLPVRVRPCRPGGLLASIVYLDLVGLPSTKARDVLIAAVEGGRMKPLLPPPYPEKADVAVSAEDEQPSEASEQDWYFSALEPRSPTLQQLLSPAPTPEGIVATWRAHETGSLGMDLGVDRQGGTVFVDFAKHGPCGYVVGTSGTGTSELLRYACVSLASHYSPKRVRLHFLDRKGGGVWRSVENLPHVANVFTDWDEGDLASHFAREMSGLVEGKLGRLRAAGVSDLGDYNKLQLAHRLPLDVLFVDEFWGDEPLSALLLQVQRQGRAAGVAIIAAASTLDYLPRNWTLMARFGVFMGTYGVERLQGLPAFASLDFELGDDRTRRRPTTGRALLGTTGAVLPFQCGWTGEWSARDDDSLYLRSDPLDQVTTLLRQAAAILG